MYYFLVLKNREKKKEDSEKENPDGQPIRGKYGGWGGGVYLHSSVLP